MPEQTTEQPKHWFIAQEEALRETAGPAEDGLIQLLDMAGSFALIGNTDLANKLRRIAKSLSAHIQLLDNCRIEAWYKEFLGNQERTHEAWGMLIQGVLTGAQWGGTNGENADQSAN